MTGIDLYITYDFGKIRFLGRVLIIINKRAVTDRLPKSFVPT